MSMLHHSTATLTAALLFAAVPASAHSILSSALRITDEAAPSIGSVSIEFDAEDWVSFIRSAAPEYRLSTLGSGIDEFGQASAFQTVPSIGFGAEPTLTQVWERP